MPAILLVIGAVIVVGALALAFLPGNNQVADTTATPVVEMVADSNSLPANETDASVALDPNTPSETTNNPAPADSTYKDGTYSTEISYQVPSGQFEPVKVTMTLDNDIVTDVELEFEGIVGTSRLNQAKFVGAYEAVVIGKDIDSLNLSRVGGASLTTKAFTNALVNIKADAA